MSLRTKLLAAVVGLNGAVLLLAVFLLLRSESEGPHAPGPGLVADLVAVGSAVTRPPETAWDRRAAAQRIDDLRARGGVERLYVVEEAEETHRVWEADAFLTGASPGDELEDAELARRVAEAYLMARREARLWSWAGPDRDTLAVALPVQ